MKKLCLLSGMIAVGTVASVNAMEKERPAAFQMIDSLVFKKPTDWVAIFAILDEMPGVIDLNDYLIPAKTPFPLLLLAVASGNFLVAKTLLEKYDVNPNISSLLNDGMTPLMLACEREDLPMVKLLLQYGANPYLKDQQGKSCFDFAKGNFEILEMLYQYTGPARAA